jgi:hypothetical protein
MAVLGRLLGMDWDWHSLGERHLRQQPLQVLELLEEHWRVVAPSGRVVTCAAYRVDGPGVEVRAGYSLDDFHRSQRVADLTHARVVAQMWRASVLPKDLKELPIRKARAR